MSMVSVPKTDLEMIFNTIGAALSNSTGSFVVKLTKSGKPRKQRASKKTPENNTVPDVTADAKPKRVMSDEHKLKMKTARELAKVKRDAEKAGIAAPQVEAPKVEAPNVEAPKVEAPKVEAPKVEAPKVEAPKVEATSTKKAVKKAKKATNTAITTPVVDAVKVETVSELLPFNFNGGTYLRMGSVLPNGETLYTSGHIWENKSGKKGFHYGEVKEDGTIDMEATEPTA
jgi:hypothetical protein